MRVLVICALLLAADLAVASAFSSDEFDEFFRDEFDQISTRVRRSSEMEKGRDTAQGDGEKKKKPRRSCCGENDDLKILWGDGVRDIKKECFDQAKKATEVVRKARMMEEYEGFIHGNRTKEEYICAVQCIGQKKEVLDHMGNVMKESMGEYVKNTYSSEPWKAEIADQVLEKCFAETQKPSEGEVSMDNGAVTNGRSVQAKCNKNGIAFIHCLWREMQLNCPADKLRESRKCNRLRERLRLQESAVKNGTERSLF
ncbi:uncharacterized protein LOC124176686 [Neodiprion fabricii]|uniref:uncharacterized protein LOC124176686 n=1 Tax=Neodiprion fabricii TaxID=2872261 RepID=UPI001ED954E4|nr:uncharacterized protein LOC124176686 [Neodiprion fabricii]